ncbi:MAG: PAS domain-containing protein [Parvibaculum sp.]|nr:PAS domain-containing protein [Parvibaculum sp.]
MKLRLNLWKRQFTLMCWRCLTTGTTCVAGGPYRSDIRPEGLVGLLPSLAIVETIDGGSDFRFRLFGTVLAEYTGVDRTGERFS